MFTRTVEVIPKSGKARELANIINDKVVPVLKKQAGFVDELAEQRGYVGNDGRPHGSDAKAHRVHGTQRDGAGLGRPSYYCAERKETRLSALKLGRFEEGSGVVGQTCSIGRQGPSGWRACIAGSAVGFRLGLFKTGARSKITRLIARQDRPRIVGVVTRRLKLWAEANQGDYQGLDDSGSTTDSFHLMPSRSTVAVE